MVAPVVSFVIPARDEAASLDAMLSSIDAQTTDRSVGVVVADGDSTDDTRAVARRHGATVVREGGHTIANGRNRGAAAADGEWLAVVGADTTVDPCARTPSNASAGSPSSRTKTPRSADASAGRHPPHTTRRRSWRPRGAASPNPA